ncbi:MAG: hypothetical protein AMS21_03435 [Gemmatimonas sp. SG8_38_2]|nr:MAG: hypothetical protein AMS21_03435 [Gemmatimonas sp. SG8_38_2]
MRCTSSYLPVEHWACRYMDLLIARGRLTGPDPMVQPYRRIDVARAIHEMECDPLSGSTRPIPNRCQSLWDGYS